MSLLEKNISWTFNSDPAVGAINVSADGSVFSVALDNPIKVPNAAIDCKAGVVQAAIFNTSPNISPSFGNNVFTFTTTNAPAGTYTFNIPEGLYSVAALNSFIGAEMINILQPANLITIAGDTATQKSIITFLVSGDSINFTVANSVRTVLGFNSVIITAPSAGFSFFSNNPASFNRNNAYALVSNLVSLGIPVNNQSRGIIASIPIDVAPGSEINYNPQNVVWFGANDLIGVSKSNITFQLVNQSLQPTPTAGDSYSFTVLIIYSILLSPNILSLKP